MQMELTLSQTSPGFYASAVCLMKTLGKGEIAHNEQFLLFLVFSTISENFPTFSSNLKLPSANSLNLEESKICRLGKG